MHRRTFIAAGGTAAVVSTAGCVSRTPGTKDLVVANCLEAETTATIRISREGTDDAVFDETVTVPEESCSDVVDGVEREDVFSEAGTYVVRVRVDGYDPARARVEFSERVIEDNGDNVVVSIRESELEIA